MPRISLKFAKKDNKISLCAHLTGTQIRHYKAVGVLFVCFFNVTVVLHNSF